MGVSMYVSERERERERERARAKERRRKIKKHLQPFLFESLNRADTGKTIFGEF